MVWVTMLLVLIACGLILAVATAVLLAFGLVHPPRMTDGKAMAVLGRLSPSDLGLAFSEVSFHVLDESRPPNKIRLAGWWIPASQPSDRTAVLLHGYADAKVGSIGWAPIFHALGWNLLAIDHRAHGESEGAFTTAGYYERHDLNQVIDQLRAQQPGATKQLVLFGVSMGSAIAVQVATMRDDLSGVILESFVGDFLYASQTHTHLLGLPGGWIAAMSARIAEWMTGADFHRDMALHAVPRVKCPVLIVLGTADPFVDQEAVRQVVRALPNVELWQPLGVDHVLAMGTDFDSYARKIDKFLAKITSETPLS